MWFDEKFHLLYLYCIIIFMATITMQIFQEFLLVTVRTGLLVKSRSVSCDWCPTFSLSLKQKMSCWALKNRCNNINISDFPESNILYWNGNTYYILFILYIILHKIFWFKLIRIFTHLFANNLRHSRSAVDKIWLGKNGFILQWSQWRVLYC